MFLNPKLKHKGLSEYSPYLAAEELRSVMGREDSNASTPNLKGRTFTGRLRGVEVLASYLASVVTALLVVTGLVSVLVVVVVAKMSSMRKERGRLLSSCPLLLIIITG